MWHRPGINTVFEHLIPETLPFGAGPVGKKRWNLIRKQSFSWTWRVVPHAIQPVHTYRIRYVCEYCDEYSHLDYDFDVNLHLIWSQQLLTQMTGSHMHFQEIYPPSLIWFLYVFMMVGMVGMGMDS